MAGLKVAMARINAILECEFKGETMICEKCGREFPDDMQKCLWCDHAPTVRPEPEIEDDDEIELDADGNPVPHPAKNFMWSVSLGGPIVAWFFHRHALKKAKTDESFFFYMFLWNIGFNVVVRVLEKVLDFINLPYLEIFLSIAWMFLWFVCIGRLGAKRIKVVVPHYNTKLYKKCEKRAIIVGAILYVCIYFGAFAVGIVQYLMACQAS